MFIFRTLVKSKITYTYVLCKSQYYDSFLLCNDLTIQPGWLTHTCVLLSIFLYQTYLEIPLYSFVSRFLIQLYQQFNRMMERGTKRMQFNHEYRKFPDLFYKYQAFFLPGHSTVYQLLETFHSIVQSIDEGKYCCMIFCDLSKAFDRVWHKGLIFKLQQYDVCGNLLHWFENYLCDRKQRYVISM